MNNTFDTRVKKEKAKLLDLYGSLPDNKLKLVGKLIENAAFMSVTLEELQKKIKKDGPTLEGLNGNGFKTVQEHPAQKSYTTMVAKYATIIRQLEEMLPVEDKRVSKLDEFIGE